MGCIAEEYNSPRMKTPQCTISVAGKGNLLCVRYSMLNQICSSGVKTATVVFPCLREPSKRTFGKYVRCNARGASSVTTKSTEYLFHDHDHVAHLKSIACKVASCRCIRVVLVLPQVVVKRGHEVIS